jgi:hypothetical protein
VSPRDERPGENDLVAALEADLAAIAAADADLERDAEVAERTRIERGALTLADRLRAIRSPVEIATLGDGRHAGRVAEMTADAVVLTSVVSTTTHPSAEHLVRLDGIVAVRGLGRAVARDRSPLPARSTTAVLRAWCRDRSMIGVLLTDGSVLTGLASAAYADHLDVSTGDGEVVTVPYAAIAVVSR